MIEVREIARAMTEEESRKLELLDLRLAAGFETQEALARTAKLAISTIYFAENTASRKKAISKKTAFKIVNAIKARGVTVKDGIVVDWKNINWLVE